MALCFNNRSGILIMTNSSNGEGMFKPLIDSLMGPTSFPFDWENYTPYNLLPPLPKLKEHKIVTLAPEQMNRLVGRYALERMVICIFRKMTNPSRSFCRRVRRILTRGVRVTNIRSDLRVMVRHRLSSCNLVARTSNSSVSVKLLSSGTWRTGRRSRCKEVRARHPTRSAD